MERRIINNILSTPLKLESETRTMISQTYKEAKRVANNCTKNAAWSQKRAQRSSKSEPR